MTRSIPLKASFGVPEFITDGDIASHRKIIEHIAIITSGFIKASLGLNRSDAHYDRD